MLSSVWLSQLFARNLPVASRELALDAKRDEMPDVVVLLSLFLLCQETINSCCRLDVRSIKKLKCDVEGLDMIWRKTHRVRVGVS